jgi:hypothetical protein
MIEREDFSYFEFDESNSYQITKEKEKLINPSTKLVSEGKNKDTTSWLKGKSHQSK